MQIELKPPQMISPVNFIFEPEMPECIINVCIIEPPLDPLHIERNICYVVDCVINYYACLGDIIANL